VGYINGANYGCEEDGSNTGIYKFVDDKLVATFANDSYVFVKTGDNQSWYMTNGYPGDDATSATLFNTNQGIDANKLRVPVGIEVTFTLVVNTDETLVLSYTVDASTCQHLYHGTDGVCYTCKANVGHTYDDGNITQQATCETAGVKIFTCSHCGRGISRTASCCSCANPFTPAPKNIRANNKTMNEYLFIKFQLMLFEQCHQPLHIILVCTDTYTVYLKPVEQGG
jgi:hypothetical protein